MTKEVISKVSEVNEDVEDVSEDHELEDMSNVPQPEFGQRKTSWHKTRHMQRRIDQLSENLNKMDSSRNRQNLRYKSSEHGFIVAKPKRHKQRELSNALIKDSPLAKINKIKNPARRNSKTYKDTSRQDRIGMRSSRGTNWNMNNLNKSSNITKGSLRGSLAFSKAQNPGIADS